MIIGSMDRYVTLESRVLTKDTTGQQVESWVKYGNVWANKYDKIGRERQEGRQEVSFRDEVFVIHYDDALTNKSADLRIIDENGALYEVKSIAMKGRRAYLEIMAEYKDSEAV